MIEALKCGGSFTFVIRVKKRTEPGFFPYSRTVVAETRRDDVIELEKNDINDPEIQEELKQYLAENDVISILLNDKEVWHEPHKRIISIDKASCYTAE